MKRAAFLLTGFLLPVLTLMLSVAPVTEAKPKPQSRAKTQAKVTLPATAPAQSSGGAQVMMNNLKYEPKNITVTVGSTVTWKNNEASPHTVAADDDSFNSPNIGKDGAFSQKFTKPGKYAYHCAYHGSKGGGMSGTITVVAAKKK